MSREEEEGGKENERESVGTSFVEMVSRFFFLSPATSRRKERGTSQMKKISRKLTGRDGSWRIVTVGGKPNANESVSPPEITERGVEDGLMT